MSEVHPSDPDDEAPAAPPPLAIAGLATGYLAIVLTVLGLVALAFLVAVSSAPTPG